MGLGAKVKVFIKLQSIIESYFVNDYDKPQYPNKDTINKIEQLLIDDMNKQSKEFINSRFKSIEYYYSNSNIEYIQSRFNYQKVKDEIIEGIKENIEDRLVNEFFQDDIEKNNLDKENNASTEGSSIDKIDELFER